MMTEQDGESLGLGGLTDRRVILEMSELEV